MKKILLTGATGLIGSVVLSKLLENEEYECWVISRKKIEIPKVHIICQDLQSEIPIETLPIELDSIIFLAQADDHHDFPNKANDMFDINVRVVMRLLEYARRVGVKSFILASSGGIYNESSSYYNEGDGVTINNQFNFYTNTKLCAELLAKCYEPYFPIITMRIFFAYGPKQKKVMLIPRLIHQIEHEEKIIINSSRGLKINPIYVSDAAEAIVESIGCEQTAVYNVAGREIVQLEDIIKIIGEKLNKIPQIVFGNNRVKDCIADNTKMKENLWLPIVDIEKGLDIIVQRMKK